MSSNMSSLFARRLRTISTASLPSDFAFSPASSSDSKPSSTISLPSLVGGGAEAGSRRSTKSSFSSKNRRSVFLPLLPLHASDEELEDEETVVKAPVGSPGASSCSAEEDAEGCLLGEEEDDDDRASDAAFSDIASSPTTPSEAPLPSDIDSDEDFEELFSPANLKALQQHAFSCLSPHDFPFLLTSSKLLTLRSTNPALCAGLSISLINDPCAPRCWRARAGVYRAEALWGLGLEEEARRELGYAERTLREGGKVEGDEEGEEGAEGRKLMEALVGWNIHVGKLNWGMYETADPAVEPVDEASQGLGIDLTSPSAPPSEVDALDLCVPFPSP